MLMLAIESVVLLHPSCPHKYLKSLNEEALTFSDQLW